jgi:hypothetical protein
VECPELELDQVWREPVAETTVDVSRDSGRDIMDYGRARSFPGYRVVVHVPFEGDGNIFHLTTNTFNFNPPRGRVSKSDLIKTIEYARDAKPNIDGIVWAMARSATGRRHGSSRSSRRSTQACRSAMRRT